MKQIFMSQDSFNLGRNRFNRILEAKLDGRKEITPPKLELCKHFSYCYLQKHSNLCSGDRISKCMTKRFYDRWGSKYNNMKD